MRSIRLPLQLHRPGVLVGAALLAAAALPVQASSHREAPLIAGMAKVDGTDFYMFASYDPKHAKAADGSNLITLVANYQPLQDSYGGPNYFALDPKALYEIHVSNTGDARSNLSFQFRFNVTNTNFSIGGVAIPLVATGPLCASGCGNGPIYAADPALNVRESYSVSVLEGEAPGGVADPAWEDSHRIRLTSKGHSELIKPIDNIGTKTIPDYAQYAGQYVYPIDAFKLSNGKICSGGQVFVGQRLDPFFVNLGQLFDLVNYQNGAPDIPATGNGQVSPFYVGGDPGNTAINYAYDSLSTKNVTSIVLELPASCLTNAQTRDPVIGGWTTASVRQITAINPKPANGAGAETADSTVALGNWVQVSRLGAPLVNEVVIGLKDKDKFNASQPKDDVANFAPYVLTPTLPQLIDLLFGIPAPAGTVVKGFGSTPIRDDLVAAFLTGVSFTLPKGANIQYGGPVTLSAPTPFSNVPAGTVTPAEMLRLNTAVPATPLTNQQRLGLIGLDAAGFPNGRRLIDDIADIELRVAEGRLCHLNGVLTNVNWACTDASAATPATTIDFGDGVAFKHVPGDKTAPLALPESFPYLNTPLQGSPNQTGY